jgi:hypothetical protein
MGSPPDHLFGSKGGGGTFPARPLIRPPQSLQRSAVKSLGHRLSGLDSFLRNRRGLGPTRLESHAPPQRHVRVCPFLVLVCFGLFAVDALVAAIFGKPLRLWPYPDERHLPLAARATGSFRFLLVRHFPTLAHARGPRENLRYGRGAGDPSIGLPVTKNALASLGKPTRARF